MMSGLHTDVQLVKRVQRKLERLEKQCSERYQLREAKVKQNWYVLKLQSSENISISSKELIKVVSLVNHSNLHLVSSEMSNSKL